MAFPFLCTGPAGTFPPYSMPTAHGAEWACPPGTNPASQVAPPPAPTALPPSAGETVAARAATAPVVEAGLPWGWILGGLALAAGAAYYLSR